MRRPMMSGFCNSPSREKPERSHERCRGGNRANPGKEFQPCPCSCHLGEEYECGGCGRMIREAPMWEDDEYPDDPVYVHIDKSGNATTINCA